MSHLPERKEKICLNCKSVVYGRFCHICGQENTEPKETFWGLITHFIYDITHFDGKFFDTTKYLLFRPGYLAYEFMRGRRASYLNPVRMYVFTSAFFFILYFSVIADSPEEKLAKAEKEMIEENRDLRSDLKKERDSLRRENIKKEIRENDSLLLLMQQTGLAPKQPGEVVGVTATPVGVKDNILNINNLPATIREYDSVQRLLPPEKRHGWLMRNFSRKIISVNMKYRGRQGEFIADISDKFKHSVPQMMFVSLPLVALVLYLLYIRRKQFYYVNHVIFSLNVYIAIFLLLLVSYLFNWFAELSGWSIFSWMDFITKVLIFYYIYKSMRNFYGQSRAKTVLKYLMLMFSILILFGVLVLLFGINSLLQL